MELDRQHLADVDLVVAVGGDGTVLSSAHFLDHGTIPLLGINSDPMQSTEEKSVKNKKSDERRYGYSASVFLMKPCLSFVLHTHVTS